jgi:hypothetical protein
VHEPMLSLRTTPSGLCARWGPPRGFPPCAVLGPWRRPRRNKLRLMGCEVLVYDWQTVTR